MPVVVVRIGPSTSSRASEAVTLARRHGLAVQHTDQGDVVRVDLDGTLSQFGALWGVLDRVRDLRGTVVEVDGAPEPPWLAQAMAHCARSWLRTLGTCGERFPGHAWPRCFLCPLFDPKRVGPMTADDIPDHVPDEWGEPGDNV